MDFTRVLWRPLPVRFSVGLVGLEGLGHWFLWVAFQGATRCGGFLRVTFFFFLYGLRGRVGQFFFYVASGAANVSGDCLSYQFFQIVNCVVSNFFRLARRLF